MFHYILDKIILFFYVIKYLLLEFTLYCSSEIHYVCNIVDYK